MSAREVLSTFLVGSFYCGIRTKEVFELTKGLEITPVPLSPLAILGLLNLRGQLVTAIDMRARLGCESRHSSADSVGIFSKQSGSLYSFVVDSVSEILELDEDDVVSVWFANKTSSAAITVERARMVLFGVP